MSAALPIAGPALPVPAKVNLGRILGGLAVIVCAFDSCFWAAQGQPGFSMTVFFAILAAAIFFNRPLPNLGRSSRIILALLAGSLVETWIETGVCNTLMLLALTVAWAGDVHFTGAASFGGRCLSQLIALVRAPGRVVWLVITFIEAMLGSDMSGFLRIAGGLVLLVPGLLLVLVFGALLASGNAVFGAWTHDGFAWIWKQITFDLSPWRMVLWIFIATATLPLLRPVQVSSWWWSWTERLPRWPDLLPHRAAFWNSALVLVALNLLFAVANLADVVFLWSGQTLPAGVTYSGFVHSGVNALTITVLLSALVLTSIFQQPLAVAQRSGLKILAAVWIVQNLFLLLSVGLRLKCYMVAYDVTVERLGVIIFLITVGAGYAVLAMKITRDKSLAWLIGGAVLVTFATLYLTQFLNLAGWAAEANVERWEKDRARKLDVEYIYNLGAAAWPALTRAFREGAMVPPPGESYSAPNTPRVMEMNFPRTDFSSTHWREFSFRAWLNRGALENPTDKK